MKHEHFILVPKIVEEFYFEASFSVSSNVHASSKTRKLRSILEEMQCLH